eukprot:357405-Chlamydomonas_euryale.AAC.6
MRRADAHVAQAGRAARTWGTCGGAAAHTLRHTCTGAHVQPSGRRLGPIGGAAAARRTQGSPRRLGLLLRASEKLQRRGSTRGGEPPARGTWGGRSGWTDPPPPAQILERLQLGAHNLKMQKAGCTVVEGSGAARRRTYLGVAIEAEMDPVVQTFNVWTNCRQLCRCCRPS